MVGGAQALFDIVHTQSLARLEIWVVAGTLEAEKSVRDVLHYVECDRLTYRLQSVCKGYRVVQERVQCCALWRRSGEGGGGEL